MSNVVGGRSDDANMMGRGERGRGCGRGRGRGGQGGAIQPPQDDTPDLIPEVVDNDDGGGVRTVDAVKRAVWQRAGKKHSPWYLSMSGF